MVLGSETPRLFTPPAGPLTPATSRGFEAIAFAEDVLGLDLMPWQKWTLIHLLELSPQGGFRFRTALILCARQQGKTVLLQILALWRLYLDRAGLVIGGSAARAGRGNVGGAEMLVNMPAPGAADEGNEPAAARAARDEVDRGEHRYRGLVMSRGGPYAAHRGLLAASGW